MDVDSTSSQVPVRAGVTVLSLLAGPLCAPILRAHLEGPLRLPDLRERIGGAAQTTLRGQVGNLRDMGALERHVRSGMPYTVENELTELGHAIVGVADTVEAWLSRAPHGPIAFGSESAKGAIRALIAGWDSTVLQALAAQPLSLTELDGAIPEVSYPALERRLSAMRAARQVEARGAPGGARPYAVTKWTRQAIGPLAAASRCECQRLADSTEAPAPDDVEAAFLLALPLVDMPSDAGGSCLFAIAADEEAAGPVADVEVEVRVERGKVVSCLFRPELTPATWATGSVDSWVTAILEGCVDGLSLGGNDTGFAHALIANVHSSLR